MWLHHEGNICDMCLWIILELWFQIKVFYSILYYSHIPNYLSEKNQSCKKPLESDLFFYLGTINLHIISSIRSKYPFENISYNYCIWEKNENNDRHIDIVMQKKYFLIIIIEIFQLKECMISMNLMHCLNNILFWKWSW